MYSSTTALATDAHSYTPNQHALLRRIRWLIAIVIAGLAVSGITAFPLEWEVGILFQLVGPGTWVAQTWPAMSTWIGEVYQALSAVQRDYPLLFYGTDWLAFAHVLLAILFVGPFRDPVRNIWVIEFGLIACVLVLPLALVFGPLRGIPFFWRMIDCSFGVVAFVPLWLARRYTLALSR